VAASTDTSAGEEELGAGAGLTLVVTAVVLGGLAMEEVTVVLLQPVNNNMNIIVRMDIITSAGNFLSSIAVFSFRVFTLSME
jgi:hypothetical protein